MSICVNFELWCECSEEELVAKLHRVADKARQLKGVQVRPLRKLDPAFSPNLFDEMLNREIPIPKVIWDRIEEPLKDDEYAMLCIRLVTTYGFNLPDDRVERFFGPVAPLIEKPPYCDPADYPDDMARGWMAFHPQPVLHEFANVMERYGYALVINPGEGSESVVLGLSTFRCHPSPLWGGEGFTKTQYATHFIPTHENVCRILDFAQEEGLASKVSDVAEYYEYRDWKRSAPIVNSETAFVALGSAFLRTAVAEANDAGAEIELLSNPIQHSQNYIVVKDKQKR